MPSSATLDGDRFSMRSRLLSFAAAALRLTQHDRCTGERAADAIASTPTNPICTPAVQHRNQGSEDNPTHPRVPGWRPELLGQPDAL